MNKTLEYIRCPKQAQAIANRTGSIVYRQPKELHQRSPMFIVTNIRMEEGSGFVKVLSSLPKEK